MKASTTKKATEPQPALRALDAHNAKELPMDKPKKPLRGGTPARNTILTSEQVRSLLEAIDNQPSYRDLHDAVKVILRSAIRPGELARLRWTDFKFGLRVMRFEDKRAGIFRGNVLDHETAALLQARLDRAVDMEFVMGNSPTQAVARVAGQFRRIAKKLNFPEHSLHILCRTAQG